MIVYITQRHIETVHAKAMAAYPYECCGLLTGFRASNGDITICDVVHSANIALEHPFASPAEPPKDRFEVDPKVRLDVMRDLRATDQILLGHYHSHPDAPAQPSATDLKLAFEPEFVWLITSVDPHGTCATTSWRLDGDKNTATQLDLTIDET